MVGGVRNGAAEEDWCWDLSPGVAAIPERGPWGFGSVEIVLVTQLMVPGA